MNHRYLILFAALTGCASFQDPAATREEVRQCRVDAHIYAKENTSLWELMAFGYLGRKIKEDDHFEQCMAARGYRTAKQ